MKCTSSYPAPINEVNLKTMQDYQKKFKVKIGFSDHTLGNVASMAATALGARVIEKHIILNKKLKSLDSFFSMDLKILKNLLKILEKQAKL